MIAILIMPIVTLGMLTFAAIDVLFYVKALPESNRRWYYKLPGGGFLAYWRR